MQMISIKYAACSNVAIRRSGGHYWFSVWQTRLEHAALATSDAEPSEPVRAGRDATALAFLQSPRTITMGKWEKIRAVAGTGPYPRRHHSMTCLADATCAASALAASESSNAAEVVDASDHVVTIRRVLIFGGQAEGIPFEASNDLHLLAVQRERAPTTRCERSRRKPN